MSTFSFVHVADLHLESPFSSLSPDHPELACIRSASMEAYERVIGLCVEKAVDFLLIAGDVFDGEDRSLRAQVRFRDGLHKLSDAGIRTFVVHGNHDPMNTWSTTLEWPKGVTLFRDRLETVEVEKHGKILARIQGISYPERDERRNLSLLFQRTGPMFHIGLLHANVGSDTGHEPYAPCTMEDLLKSGVDYWALGHVHRKRILAQDHPWIIYPGNTQGRSIKESGEKGCTLVRVVENMVGEIQFHETDSLRWCLEDVSIRDLLSEQDLLKALDAACRRISEGRGGRPTIARIILSGSGPLYGFLRKPTTLPDLLETLHDTGMTYSPFVWVDQIELKVSPELDMEGLRGNRDFIGELLRYSGKLSGDKRCDEIVMEELSFLFDDPKVHRFLEHPGGDELRTLLKEAEEFCAKWLQEEEGE